MARGQLPSAFQCLFQRKLSLFGEYVTKIGYFLYFSNFIPSIYVPLRCYASKWTQRNLKKHFDASSTEIRRYLIKLWALGFGSIDSDRFRTIDSGRFRTIDIRDIHKWRYLQDLCHAHFLSSFPLRIVLIFVTEVK